MAKDVPDPVGVEFRRELVALLEKYDVSIGFGADDGSDWYGLSGEYIQISDDNRVLVRVDGTWMGPGNIKEEYPNG